MQGSIRYKWQPRRSGALQLLRLVEIVSQTEALVFQHLERLHHKDVAGLRARAFHRDWAGRAGRGVRRGPASDAAIAATRAGLADRRRNASRKPTKKVFPLALEPDKVLEVVVAEDLAAHGVQPGVDDLGHILAVLVLFQFNDA